MRKNTVKFTGTTIDKSFAVNISADGTLKVMVQKVDIGEGKYALKVWAVKEERSYAPTMVRISRLSRDIRKLEDTGISLDAKDLCRCVIDITQNLDDIPVIASGDILGFQRVDGELQFRGACDIDMQGKFYPSTKYEVVGCADVRFMKSYVVNTKRQLLLLHTLAAPVFSLYKEMEENPMIFLYGESSTGKSTVARYLQSLAIERNERTAHGFNATAAGFMESLGVNNGLPICLDDTSAGDAEGTRGSLKNYQQLIYNLAAGMDRKRYKDKVNSRIRTSILITAENNDLLRVSPDLKGIYSRVMPMYITAEDLFDDVKQVNRCKDTTVNNTGVVYSLFVRELMRLGEDALRKEVKKEKQQFEKKYQSEDGIINRWCLYWGILAVTGRIVKKIFDVDCDVDAIAEYMKKELLFNLHIQSEESTRTRILEDLYETLDEHVINIQDRRYVQVREFNKCAERMKIDKRVAKDMLYHAGLIKLQPSNELTKNVGSGYGRCLLLAS